MKKVIAVCGPTAVGKTRMGVSLAEALHGEVISGDSMQIYRTMDIGTAKATPEEMQGIIHHMIDIKNPDETFSVSEEELQGVMDELGMTETDLMDPAQLNELLMAVSGAALYRHN